MVAEGRCRNTHFFLDFSCGGAFLRTLDDQPKDGEPDGMTKGLEALCVLVHVQGCWGLGHLPLRI